MTIKHASTIAAVLSLAGIVFASVPAMAASPANAAHSTICNDTSTPTTDAIDDNAGDIITRLSSMGVKGVTGVDNFGNCVRAYITNPNGTTTMAYFTPDNLHRIDVAG